MIQTQHQTVVPSRKVVDACLTIGTGRYESTFVRSRLMDAVAAKLGIDPVEVRRRNLITADELPYVIAFNEPGVEELEFDSGDYPALLEKSLKAFGWDKLQADMKRRRAAGELVGAGVAIFMEESGRGPSDNAKIKVDPDGVVELITGGASLGQGFETSMAQICAEALGVDYQRVRVIHGQTDLIDHGIGAHAARATVLTGGAVHVTATMVREKAIEFASELLQTPAADLDIVDGTVMRAGRREAARRSRSAISPSASRRARNCCAAAIRSSPRMAGTIPTIRCFPMACISRSSASIARPARSRSSASWSPTTSVARSIRC